MNDPLHTPSPAPAPVADRGASPAVAVTATLLAAGLALSSAALLSGCSTVKGAGEDLQYASDKTAEALGGDTDDDD